MGVDLSGHREVTFDQCQDISLGLRSGEKIFVLYDDGGYRGFEKLGDGKLRGYFAEDCDLGQRSGETFNSDYDMGAGYMGKNANRYRFFVPGFPEEPWE